MVSAGIIAMQKTFIQLPAMKFVGISIRTNNAAEMNPQTAKIGSTVENYFRQALAEKIKYRKKPGTTICIYTNYESDISGNYTYFIGEEVTEVTEIAEGFESIIIPASQYVKFTNGPDKMPNVCISAWQQIWAMKPADFGGERAYIADFEVYDERSRDPENTIIDIYIGIKK